MSESHESGGSSHYQWEANELIVDAAFPVVLIGDLIMDWF